MNTLESHLASQYAILYFGPFFLPNFAIFWPLNCPLSLTAIKNMHLVTCLSWKPFLNTNYAFWALLNPIWLHNRWFCVFDPFWCLFLPYFFRNWMITYMYADHSIIWLHCYWWLRSHSSIGFSRTEWERKIISYVAMHIFTFFLEILSKFDKIAVSDRRFWPHMIHIHHTTIKLDILNKIGS